MNLAKINFFHGRAEDFAKPDKLREKYDLCVSRAVANLSTLSEYCLPFVKKGGIFVAYKGEAEEELKEAQNAIKILGGSLSEHFRYELENAQRALISIKKVKNTDKKYEIYNEMLWR